MIKNLLCHCANTLFGMYQRPYSEAWDKHLNEIMDGYKYVEAGQYTITFEYENDIIEIWTSNRWYAFGHIYYVNGKGVEKEHEFRPRFMTMLRLWDLYSSERNKFLNENYDALFNHPIR